MDLPGTLQQKIREFLTSLPNLDDTQARRAFIYSAGLDSQLQEHIPFDKPPAQFVPLLVSELLKYGTLNDGQYALEAVLEAAKQHIGKDRKEYCDILIKEFRSSAQTQHASGESVPRYLPKPKKKVILITISATILVIVILAIAVQLLLHKPTPRALSPKKTVEEYFRLINEGEYRQSWEMLSKIFKREKNNTTDFDQYQENWERYKRLYIKEIDTITEDDTTAIVSACITGSLKSERNFSSFWEIGLRIERETHRWFIDTTDVTWNSQCHETE